MTRHPQSGTWTDDRLDDALRTLGGPVTLDDDRLDVLRARLLATAGDDEVPAGSGGTGAAPRHRDADTLEVGPAAPVRLATRRRRLGQVMTLAAVAAAVVALAIVLLVPGRRAEQPAARVPAPDASSAAVDRLVDPYPVVPAQQGTVLLATSGTGSASVAFAAAPAAGDTVTYWLSCGDPTAAPGGSGDASTFTAVDTLGSTGSGSCPGVVAGAPGGSAAGFGGVTAPGRTSLTLTFSGPGTVWRLAVVATGPGTSPRSPAASDLPPAGRGTATTLPVLGTTDGGAVLVAPTRGTADARIAVPATTSARIRTAAVCIGGGTLVVTDPTGGSVVLRCDGGVSGSSGPTGSGPLTLTVAQVKPGQQWRVAAFTSP